MSLRPRPRPMNALQSSEKVLLSKQLASIAATLANASKRRDTAAKEIVSRGASRPSTPMPAVRSLPAGQSIDGSSCSSPLSRSPAVVNGAAPDDTKLATTGGAQAVKAVDKEAIEHKENVKSSSHPVSELRGEEIAFGDGDLQSMLQELEELSIQSRTPLEHSAEEEEEDIDLLRDRLEKMKLHSPKRITPEPATVKTRPTPPLVVGPTLERVRKDCKPTSKTSQRTFYYATALQLEKTGIMWEIVQGWTTYLFSTGPYGHDAQRQKHEIVHEANEEYNTLIKKALDEESAYWATEEKNLLLCRLVVSNIAVGADEEELALLFSEFKYDIRNIKMLERDSASRSQTAHVDMYTKDAAKQASYKMCAIYGLMVKIRLAADDI